jgi:hypothetical protein
VPQARITGKLPVVTCSLPASVSNFTRNCSLQLDSKSMQMHASEALHVKMTNPTLFDILCVLPSSTSGPFVIPRPTPQTCGRGRCPLGYGLYRSAPSTSSSPATCPRGWLLWHTPLHACPMWIASSSTIHQQRRVVMLPSNRHCTLQKKESISNISKGT